MYSYTFRQDHHGIVLPSYRKNLPESPGCRLLSSFRMCPTLSCGSSTAPSPLVAPSLIDPFCTVPYEAKGALNRAQKYPAKEGAGLGPRISSCRSGLRPQISCFVGSTATEPEGYTIHEPLGDAGEPSRVGRVASRKTYGEEAFAGNVKRR